MTLHPATDLAHITSVAALTVLVDEVRDFLHVGERAGFDRLSVSFCDCQEIVSLVMADQSRRTYLSSDMTEYLPTIQT